jgi:hypothetical protein
MLLYDFDEARTSRESFDDGMTSDFRRKFFTLRLEDLTAHYHSSSFICVLHYILVYLIPYSLSPLVQF